MASTFQVHPNVLKATLVEDFIVTAVETKQSYIRVKIEGFLTKSDPKEYPLAIVYSWYSLLPLKKDDVVYVFAPTDSPQSLYLYSVDPATFSYPQALLDAMNYQNTMPTAGTIVTFPSVPSSPSPVTVTYVSKDFYIISMDGITQFISGTSFTIYMPNKIISYTADSDSYEIKCGKYMLEAGDLLKLKAKAGFLLESTNNFELKSNNVDLKNIMNQIFTVLGDLYDKIGGVATDAASLASTVLAGAGIDPPLAAASVQVTSLTADASAAPISKTTNVTTFKSSSVDVFFQET